MERNYVNGRKRIAKKAAEMSPCQLPDVFALKTRIVCFLQPK